MMRTLCGVITAIVTWACTIPSIAASLVLEDCVDHHCVAVVDAGSTGSRIYLYRYDLDPHSNPIAIQTLYSKKIKPGLASISANAEAIAAYFTNLMQDFPQKNIPLHLYSTGGMRLLPSSSQQKYYAQIAQWFSTQTQWPLVEARTISGQEEGVYGWISLNDHLHTLQDTSKPLVSLLEIGGASAQIVFPLDSTTGISKQNWQSVTVHGRQIFLFAQTVLGLGVNEVFKLAQNQSMCFPHGYPLLDGTLATGDAQQCAINLGSLLQQTYPLETQVQTLIQQQARNDWYTVASIAAMASHSPFDFPEQVLTPNTVLQQADSQFCQQRYQDVLSLDLDKEYIQKNCLIGAYFYSLLVHYFGFSSGQNVHFQSQYDGNWTIGALLTDFAYLEQPAQL